MTNYPWYIGSKGTTLNVPTTHSGQGTNGRIWLAFGGDPLNVSTGVDNFYLTTNNNCAMIQTGHSNGQATDDEQKILANLIFYMNQLLFSQSSLRDASAQDTVSPLISGHEIPADGTATIALDAADQGTTYKYYVESYSKDDTTSTGKIATSATESTTIETSISRFAYIFSDVPDTPDFESVSESSILYASSPEISYVGHEGEYCHVIAIDGAGNKSPVYTLQTPSPASFEIPIKKTMLCGTSIAADEFSFSVWQVPSTATPATSIAMPASNESDTLPIESVPAIAAAAISSDGTATIVVNGDSAIKAPGEYIYAVSEKAGEDTGIRYDETRHIIRVSATDQRDGTMSLVFTESDPNAGTAEEDPENWLDAPPTTVFENQRKPAIVSISNDVSGTDETLDESPCEFSVEMDDVNGEPISEVGYVVYCIEDGQRVEVGTGTVERGGILSLPHGAEADLILPHGSTYQISSPTPPRPGFSYSPDMATGTVSAANGCSPSEALFSTVYSAKGAAAISGSVICRGTGRPVDGDTFIFVLTDSDGQEIGLVESDRDGKFSFSPIELTESDRNTEKTYTIRQIVPSEENDSNGTGDNSPRKYIYDEEEETVSVRVSDNGDGTLSIIARYGKGNITDTSSPIPFENDLLVDMPEAGGAGRNIIVAIIGAELVAGGVAARAASTGRARRRDIVSGGAE